mmetsp:Transcript_11735/g.10023  ORF Transcript_11735/g.10023 Transcript_11735/m.10023 type:complete len:88 (+) Transcript_11735:243-506(+)
MEFFVSQSFAKNFGLYGERAGMCHFVTKSADLAARALSQLKLIIPVRVLPDFEARLLEDLDMVTPGRIRYIDSGLVKELSGKLTDEP